MVRGRSTEEVHYGTRTQHGGGTLWYGRTGACGGTMPGLGLSGSTGQIDEGGTLQQTPFVFASIFSHLISVCPEPVLAISTPNDRINSEHMGRGAGFLICTSCGSATAHPATGARAWRG
jgi:hypothetical protein